MLKNQVEITFVGGLDTLRVCPPSHHGCSVVMQAVADRSAGALRMGQLGNISAKAQKDIADVSSFMFQVATSAFPACCSIARPALTCVADRQDGHVVSRHRAWLPFCSGALRAKHRLLCCETNADQTWGSAHDSAMHFPWSRYCHMWNTAEATTLVKLDGDDTKICIPAGEDFKYPTTKGVRTNSPADQFLGDYVQVISSRASLSRGLGVKVQAHVRS